MPDVFLRAARAEDQATIRHIIRATRLNPFGLHWQRFVVAQAGNQVVGIGQVKILGDGSPELASLAVLPAHRKSGIGGAIVWTMISRTPGPIYLRCASHNEGYYRRFGFRTLAVEEMPRPLRRAYRIGNRAIWLVNWESATMNGCWSWGAGSAILFGSGGSMPSLPPEHERLYTRIYTVVRQIPPGKVATYGQIAEIVGDCTARMVGYAMAASPDDVPWQRVINVQGKVSPRADSWGSEVQRLRLEEEGVIFSADHKVDFAQVRWSGPSLDWLLENGFTPHERDEPGDDSGAAQPRLF